MITDADKDFSLLESVFEIKSEDENTISGIKGVFEYEARRGGDSGEALRIAENAYGAGSISQRTPNDNRADAGHDGFRERGLRRAENRGAEYKAEGLKQHSFSEAEKTTEENAAEICIEQQKQRQE